MIEGTARNIMLVVDDAICQACERCLAGEVCRGSAFRRIDREDAPFIDMSRCWGCMECVMACPNGAVVRHDYNDH